jgi:HK97 family phage portal protein
VRGLSDDGLWGHSPLTLHRETVGHAIATQEYGSRFFSQGARPGGVLQSPVRLTPEASERMAHSWVSAHQGLSNAHRIAVLEEGVEWHSTGMSNDDAEYLDSRRFSVAEIARIFRIPPHMIGDVERSTSWGTGIEQQTIGFVTFTLMPWLERIEQQLQKDLLTPFEKPRYYVKHIVAALLRGDATSRAAFYTALWDRNVLSANDIREFEDMNPIDEDQGGEDYHYPANFLIAGEEPPVPAPAPPPAPTARVQRLVRDGDGRLTGVFTEEVPT